MIDVNPNHLDTVTRILAGHVPECEVRAFGSRVTWTAKDYSDLDLAVVGAHALDPDVLRSLKEAFEESDLPFRVDVLAWHAISAAFRNVIEKKYEVVQEGKQKSLGMAGEWTTVRLGDVCSKIGSGATPRGGSSVYLEHGDIALIRSQNIYNDGFHHDGLTYLTEEHAAELANVEVAEDDVLLNITGDSVARSCQVDPDVLPARVNQHVAIIRPDPTVLLPRFLRYSLVSPGRQAEMLSLAGAGATRNALTKGMIESFEVQAPTNIDEQRAIARILGTLDDKIELNRRMNETLEATARALFKSWFVDFDPVRAKAEGRDPSLPSQLANLFPDSFEESAAGEIPKNWRCAGIGERATALSGGTPSKSDPRLWDGDIPWISPKVMTGIHADEADQHVSQRAIGHGTRLAPSGSTLVMVRGMGLHRQVRVSQARREVSFNQDVKALVPTRIDAVTVQGAVQIDPIGVPSETCRGPSDNNVKTPRSV